MPIPLRRLFALWCATALAAALAAPAAHAYRLGGIPWPGSPARVGYWNGTPYGPQVEQAARAWNRSGARVRFVRVRRAQARLRIVTDPRIVADGTAHGLASVGYQPRNRIVLGAGGGGVGLVGLIAHEFGHVLGLLHEDRRCATLNSVAWSRCLPAPPCSILEADDVRGAIRRYGGRWRPQAAELCPPPPLALALVPGERDGQLLAAATLPGAAGIRGAVVRSSVGRCPDRPATTSDGISALPGGVVTADVTPRRALPSVDGRTLCVRAWSYDATGRVSATPATQQTALAPVAAS